MEIVDDAAATVRTYDGWFRSLTGEGLGTGQVTVLRAVPDDGCVQRSIVQHTGLDASTVTVAVSRLTAHGLLRREPHPRDRRSDNLFRTELGDERLEQITAGERRVARRLRGLTTADERSAAGAVLALVRESLRRELA